MRKGKSFNETTSVQRKPQYIRTLSAILVSLCTLNIIYKLKNLRKRPFFIPRKPLPITPSAIHNTYTNMQNTFTPPPQSFHVDPYKDSLTPLSRPMSHGPAKTFTQELLDNDFDDFDDLSLGHPSAANHHNEVGRNWESFSAHFTQEFEWLKGEVDSLRNDVKSLRRTVRELKVRNFF